MRIIDPAAPSPLVSLMSDVEGAADYARWPGHGPSTVGLHADEREEVTVDLDRPAADFVTVVASPTFSVVPPGMDERPRRHRARRRIRGERRLQPRRPRPRTIDARPPTPTTGPASRRSRRSSSSTDIGGRSAVEAFEDGELDYLPIGDFDASWIAYDGISDRSCARCRRCRSSTTASTRRARRSMT